MEYQGKFGQDVCEVYVEARASQNSGPVYIALLYVLANHTLYWFENDKGKQLEIFGVDERDALARAHAYLLEKVGPQVEPLALAPELKSAVPLMPISKMKPRSTN